VVGGVNNTKLTNKDIRAIIRQLPKGVEVDAADAEKLLDEYGIVK
jgi:hypothetical protein